MVYNLDIVRIVKIVDLALKSKLICAEILYYYQNIVCFIENKYIFVKKIGE